MSFVKINELRFPSPYEEEVEIVERKGKGHPDTLIDLLSENLSVELSKLYLEEFGAIMHHNVDKGLIVGGEAEPAWKGGKVLKPIDIYLVGRAIKDKEGKELGVEELAVKVTQEWIKENIPHMNIEHFSVHPLIRPGSKDLVELFERFSKKGEVPLANDTSFGVSFYPFDALEKGVFNIERILNSKEFKRAYPMIGEDIKVMGVRIKDKFKITIAMAFVDKYLRDIREYMTIKEEVRLKAKEELVALLGTDNVEVDINTADNPQNESVYITVTGTSAEQGDDGEVGRGNRINGLITPYRPMSLEAAAGKNPVSHVGKIYNVFANIISRRVVEEVDGVKEAYTYIVSQIGKPITQPQACDVRVKATKPIREMENKIDKIIKEEIEHMRVGWELFLNKEVDVV